MFSCSVPVAVALGGDGGRLARPQEQHQQQQPRGTASGGNLGGVQRVAVAALPPPPPPPLPSQKVSNASELGDVAAMVRSPLLGVAVRFFLLGVVILVLQYCISFC